MVLMQMKKNVKPSKIVYQTCLTDKQWKLISRYFKHGNRSKYHKRTLVNAVLYLVKTGCQWRMLPKNFPPYQTVHSFFRRARLKSVWKKVLFALTALSRIKAGKKASPTYCLIDSQSAKTTSASEERGIDGGKKVKGRKRHIVTDTMGNILAVVVHAANVHDTVAGIMALRKAFELYPSLKGVCADAGYRKTFVKDAAELGLPVDISEKIKPGEWEILPFRWIVERTFAWQNNYRRLSKDFEITLSSEESYVMIAHAATLIRRLGK
jgi:putative transposase